MRIYITLLLFLIIIAKIQLVNNEKAIIPYKFILIKKNT